jgi:hypothetical protein
MLSMDFILLRRLRLKVDLVPGPAHDDKARYNQAIQILARYPAEEIAAAIGQLSGVTPDPEADPGQNSLRWVWSEGGRSMQIGFLPLEDGEPPCWGGSELDLDCYVGDLLQVWQNLRLSHPDIWLHYDGRVYTPTTFLDRLREMIEDQVITDII